MRATPGGEAEAPFDTTTAAWSAGVPTAPDALRAWQLARAWDVAEAVAASNPFYAPRIRLPAERTAAAFRSLPVTTKADVVDDCAAHPPYGSRTACPLEAVRHVVETSGTSGRGRETYALDADDERAIFRAEAVGFWWAGVRPGTPVLLTLPVGTTAAGLWYYGGLRLIGANVFSVGPYDTGRKVAALERYQPELVIATPSYLERLATACEREGVDPAGTAVKSLMVAGEPYSARWAAQMQARWGAVLYEQYGCTERIIAWACPGGVLKEGQLGVLHFPPEISYSEVVDPDSGEPVADRECGELVGTPLAAAASPLLRFATRDRVEYVEAGSCPCGRPLPGIRAGGVQRYDDMMKIRGLNVWPATFDAAVFAVPGVANYRGTVSRAADGGERVEIHVECDPGREEEVARAVRAEVRTRIGLSTEVTCIAPGTIGREVPEGFVKMSRWRDLRR